MKDLINNKSPILCAYWTLIKYNEFFKYVVHKTSSNFTQKEYTETENSKFSEDTGDKIGI